jgi:aromatic ring-opening dioxygenase LigB subunit
MGEVVFGCLTPHPPLIVPDIGKGEERAIQKTIDAMVQLAAAMAGSKPESCLVISPHGESHSDAMGILTAPGSTGDLKTWGVRGPTQHFNNDPGLVELIVKQSRAASIPIRSIAENRYTLDHGVMVPLHFLTNSLSGARLVPLTFSWLPLLQHFDFGKAIHRAIIQTDRKVAVIASGDMSHRLKAQPPYGYDPASEIFDGTIVRALTEYDVKAILNLDPKVIERAGECGLRSILILLGILDGLKVKSKVLSYEGPFGVGYLVASFEVIQ